MAVARGHSASPHLLSLCVASYSIYGQGDALKTGPYPASALEHLLENRAAGLAWLPQDLSHLEPSLFPDAGEMIQAWHFSSQLSGLGSSLIGIQRWGCGCGRFLTLECS